MKDGGKINFTWISN